MPGVKNYWLSYGFLTLGHFWGIDGVLAGSEMMIERWELVQMKALEFSYKIAVVRRLIDLIDLIAIEKTSGFLTFGHFWLCL